MNAKTSSIQLTLVTILTCALSVTTAMAQPYDLSWHTVDGGGAMFSTGGAFQLGGTIGQADAGSFIAPMSGGSYELVGGFWPAAADVCGCPGDTNADGVKNARDIQNFVGCLISGNGCNCADVDGVGGVNAADVNVFVNDLLSGDTCP
jgi:hypothetical protein